MLVIYYSITNNQKFNRLKLHLFFLFQSFHGSGVQAWLNWVLCNQGVTWAVFLIEAWSSLSSTCGCWQNSMSCACKRLFSCCLVSKGLLLASKAPPLFLAGLCSHRPSPNGRVPLQGQWVSLSLNSAKTSSDIPQSSYSSLTSTFTIWYSLIMEGTLSLVLPHFFWLEANRRTCPSSRSRGDYMYIYVKVYLLDVLRLQWCTQAVLWLQRVRATL